MEQPNREIQQKQYNIANDVPFVVQLGSRNFNCTYLKGKSQDMISMLHLSQKVIESDDPKEVLAALKHNNRIHAKAVAIMILNSYWRIKLLYHFFWRWIFHTYSSNDLTQAMQIVMQANGVEFFFQNMALLSATNTLKKKLTKEEVSQLLAGHQSGSEQHSSRNSAESQDTATIGK